MGPGEGGREEQGLTPAMPGTWEGNRQGSLGCMILQPSQGLSPQQELPEERDTPSCTPVHPRLNQGSPPSRSRGRLSQWLLRCKWGAARQALGQQSGSKTTITCLEKGQDTGTNPLRPVTNTTRCWFNEKWPFEA